MAISIRSPLALSKQKTIVKGVADGDYNRIGEAHYEVRDVEMGKVYTWRPRSVVVQCECDKNPTLLASMHACGECGADHRPVVEEVLEAPPDEEKDRFNHPWRSLRPYYAPTRGT